MLLMGEELRLLPTFVILLLADVMGICFVSILRDQFKITPIMDATTATSVSSPSTASKYIIKAIKRRPIKTPKNIARKLFPGAVMCTTAMDQIDTKDKSSTKILAGAVVVGLIVSFLQNMEYIPWMISFTSWLPVKFHRVISLRFLSCFFLKIESRSKGSPLF